MQSNRIFIWACTSKCNVNVSIGVFVHGKMEMTTEIFCQLFFTVKDDIGANL